MEVFGELTVHRLYLRLEGTFAGHLIDVGVDVVLAVLQHDSARNDFEALRLQDIVPVLGHGFLHQVEVQVESLTGKGCGILHSGQDLCPGDVCSAIVDLGVELEHVPQEPSVLKGGPLVLQPFGEYSGVLVGSLLLKIFDALHSLEGGDEMSCPKSSLLDVSVGNIVEEEELLFSEVGVVLAEVVAERTRHRGEELRDCGHENPEVDSGLTHEVLEEVLDLYHCGGSHE